MSTPLCIYHEQATFLEELCGLLSSLNLNNLVGDTAWFLRHLRRGRDCTIDRSISLRGLGMGCDSGWCGLVKKDNCEHGQQGTNEQPHKGHGFYCELIYCRQGKINELEKKIKTHIWGPSAWTFLHAISFSYPDAPTPEHKTAVLNLFSSLKYLLPCGECCNHYCSTFSSEELSKALQSKHHFSRWLVDFHNSVNVRLNKPIFQYDVAAAKFLAEDAVCEIKATSCADDAPMHARDAAHARAHTPPNNTFWLGLILGVIVLLIIVCQRKSA